jgi:hypothetical protein
VSLVFTGTDQDIKNLEAKYGVSIDRSWLGYTVVSSVHEDHPQIFKAPMYMSPAELDSQLNHLRNAKIRSLEKQYDVSIHRFGSSVNETAYGQMHMTAEKVPVRTPTLGEVLVLEYALKHSCPGQLSGRSLHSHGIDVYFLDARTYHTASEWGLNGANRPAIFLESRDGLAIQHHTLEETLMHQLAHNSAYRMGWNPKESWKWPTANQLGWKFAGSPELISHVTLNGATFYKEAGKSGWLLRTIEGPDFTYKLDKQNEMWIRCDKNMNPLDDKGNKVAVDEKARRMTYDEIRPLAIVPPVSPEFPTPPEVFADAMAMFRADKATRAELYIESPSLYKVVRDFDQLELDTTYGKGVMIRNVDGVVTPPSREVLKDIYELEHGKAT